jgi:hypothetical protein
MVELMIGRTKMTIKVYSPLWETFNAQIGALPVSRDQFLNCVLRRELPLLAEAMNGKRLSRRANRWISNGLMRLGTRAINIGLDREVAHSLNRIVKESHMVRDAFFNRLIVFLRSSDAILNYFKLPKREDGRIGKEYVDTAKPVSPLCALSEVFDDPLWYLHMATKHIHDTSLYLLPFPSPIMDGFACWIEDAAVPDTREYRRQQRELDKQRRSLTEFESKTFTLSGTR